MARKTGRLNRLLEMIGLVDDEPGEEDMNQERQRSSGAQTYSPSARRGAPQSGSRNTYQYDERAAQRYRGDYPARPDYDRRGGYQPASAPRYDRGAAPRADGDRYASRSDADRYASRADADRGSAPRASYDRSAPTRPSYDRVSARPDFDRSASREPDRASDKDEERRARANVVNLRADARQQTVIYYLRSLEECRDVITDLIDNKTVLLNLEDMDDRVVQRAIDTLCGAAFALNATLRKASDKTYLIAPNSVVVASTNDVERNY